MLNVGNRLRNCWWLLVIPVVTAGIACLSNPCLHGICIDDVNSTYSCYCTDGFTGIQCQTNWDECWSNPCQNGGTCIDGVAMYNCSCPEGFIGDDCETNYNECESNPCLNNGTCIDMTNDYVCHCIPGFSGDHCEYDVAVCNSTEEIRCHNGGECIEGPGFKFYCKCMPGWTGPKCEEQIDECESNPCQNGGICIDAHADYMCACAYGYTGKSCEVKIEFCDENACSNGALCVVEDGERICYCVPDYHGDRCELQYDECLLGPRCMNGGTCIDGVDNFTCSCPPRLTGSLCECFILDDGSHDCKYVRPTPLPMSTNLVLTSVFTDITTKSFTTPLYNNTSTVFTFIPNDSTTLRVTDSIDTTLDLISTTVKSNETEMSSTSLPSTLYQEMTSLSIDVSTEIAMTTTQGEANNTDTSLLNGTVATTVNIDTTISTAKELIEETTPLEKSTTALTTELVKEWTTTHRPFEETTRTFDDTTIKLDTTTEKMFTNSPDKESSTEITTELLEVTSATDSTSQFYPTEHIQCTPSVCNNRGTCFNGPNGIRCHCTFSYNGRFCEEKIAITSAAFGGNSFIVHHIGNSTSLNIEFDAKTLITDGEIMHVDIAQGVYLELYMMAGLLKFKFSCGYQTMLLSELKTYVNRGYAMKIEIRLDLFLNEQHCNATLRLNDTVAMSGGQIANITTLNPNSTLLFGNAYKNRTEYTPFIGCISGLIVNGERRALFGDAYDAGDITECSSLACLSGPCLNGGTCNDRGETYHCSCANGWLGELCNTSVCDNNPCQSGGSCVKHPGSGFLCLCPYGKHGIFCEYNVDITRASLAPITSGKSSYVIYPLSPMAMNSDRFDLRLRFQTDDLDQIALLAFVGQNGRHDSKSQHMALTFVKGYVMLTWNMGSGARRIFTSRALSTRRGGHMVRVWRRGRTAGLSVDGRHNVSGNAPANDVKMNILPYVYIGKYIIQQSGHPSEDFRDLPHDLPLHNGWKGCVWEVGGQAIGTGKPVGGYGVGQCGVAQCTAKSCNSPRGVCIHSPATYGCICNEDWFGATCASRHSPCDFPGSKCHGRCVITTGNASCDCPYGKSGPNCDKDLYPIDIFFTGQRSYIKFHPRSISSVSLSLETELKPAKERGLIIYVATPHFYTSLSLQGGLLEYRWTDRLSGLTSIVRSGVVLSMSQWHAVKAGRYGTRLYIWVDGALTTEPMLAHAYPHTASEASIVLGGAEDLSTLPFDVMLGPPQSYVGCLKNLHVNNIPLTLEQHNIAAGQNVEACDGSACSNGRCRRAACNPAHCPSSARCRNNRCVCPAGLVGEYCQKNVSITIPQFDGDAMVSLNRRPFGRNEQRLSTLPTKPSYISFNFSTAEPSGLLLWIDMGADYIGLGLENGFLKLVWSLHCNNLDQPRTKPKMAKGTSRIVQSGFMADGEWHMVVLHLRENISLFVNQAMYFDEVCFNDHEFVDVDTYIGGVTEDIPKVKTLFPQNFKGCIDNISSKEASYLNDFSDVYSENLVACQPFPT
ncbi:unnamed protein product [Leptosia nina]|uniref:Protein eyes shut n=1 Tax=Leptosia nina TaxID=320188 RepID=A0AAV1JJQ4_9NEOP